ncbi:MAG: carboxylate-amine ligase [Pseudomonadota bacterium]
MTEPSFTLGIEEEYLLVDQETRTLTEAPDALMEDCKKALGDQVSPEFLRCQIEVGTKVCETIGAAREDLRHLRRTVAEIAGRYGIAPLAVSCHPTADWKDQSHTDRDRYNELGRDLAGVGRRMLISGAHVHVGIDGDDLRVDLMNQASYFLPHLLALSCSSPFWQGEDTGLASYRLTVFDNLPRTGLPPRLESFSSYQRAVDAIVKTGAIEDATKVWWDLRPSDRFATLETRICDMCPRLEHILTIAALTQCILRMLWRLKTQNQRWRIYDHFLVGENRWRAQRYGMSEGLIDFGRGEVVPFPDLMEELVDLLAEDARALQAMDEVWGVHAILENGNSAERQRKVHEEALSQGLDEASAFRTVLDALIEEFQADL